MNFAAVRSWIPRPAVVLMLLLIVAFILTQASVLLQSRTGREHILRGTDPLFYYGLTRSVIFDHDVDITNDIGLSPVVRSNFTEPIYGEYRNAGSSGRITSPYGIGTSILQIPWMVFGSLERKLFLLVGHHSDAPPGYSAIEINTVCMGMIWYTLCGLYVAVLLMKPVVSIPVGVGLVLCGWCGSNLFYYSVISPFMAHGPAFLFIVLSLLWARKVGAELRWKTLDFAILGVLAGFLFLIRPQQVLLFAILLPILIGRRLLGAPRHLQSSRERSSSSWLRVADLGRALLEGTKAHVSIVFAVLCVFSLAFALVAGLQLLHNFAQFGALLMNPYESRQEHFQWLMPQFFPVLLQPDRGLFVVQPIAILSVIGLVISWNRLSMTGLTLFGHAALQAYVVACWAFPGSGADPFGPRLWCECAAAIMIGLAYLFTYTNGRLFLGLCGIATLVSTIWTLSLLAAKPALIGLTSYKEVIALALRFILR